MIQPKKTQKFMKTTFNPIVRTHFSAVNSKLTMLDAQNNYQFQKINIFKNCKNIRLKITMHHRPWSTKMSWQTNLWGRETKIRSFTDTRSRF